MVEHEHGGNIYKYRNCLDFSTNLNPLGPPERVKQAVIQSLDHLQDYPQTGYEPLREAIGAYEGVLRDCVICGNGAAELIYTLCQAIRPKKALLPAPTFAEYGHALESVGCEITYFPMLPEDEYQLTGKFSEALYEEPDIVFLCNPNNPTGLLIPEEVLRQIVEICEKRDIWLVVDECFLDFVRDQKRHTLKKDLRTHQNLFLLKAFTKRYAIAGIRLGYGLCGNQELLKKMRTKVQPWNISCMAMAAGIAALKETEYVEAGRQIVFREREYLQEALRKLGLKVFPSQANYLFFEGPEGFFEACVKQGILIRDCSNYHGLGSGFYRIAVRKHEENLALVQAFQKICGKSL